MIKKKRRLLKIIFACTLSMGILGTSVYGYERFGGKWDSGYVHYAINSETPESYKQPIIDAANMWHDNTNVSLTRSNSSNINVYVGDYGDHDWDGLSAMNDGYDFTGHFSYGAIFLNKKFMKDYDNLHEQLVVEHEFGHELGLAHNPNNDQCLMYGDEDGGHVYEAYQNNNDLANRPAQDDIDGINSMY